MAWIQGSVPAVQVSIYYWALSQPWSRVLTSLWLLGIFPLDLFSLPFGITSNFHSYSYFTFIINRQIYTWKPENKKKNGRKNHNSFDTSFPKYVPMALSNKHWQFSIKPGSEVDLRLPGSQRETITSASSSEQESLSTMEH